MNIKNVFKISFALLLSAMLMSSCTSDNEEELFPAVEESQATVSLENDVQPIITQNCAVTACHVAGSQSPNLSTKEGTLANKDRVNARAVAASSPTMPPSFRPQMMQSGRDVIGTWIAEGGLDN